MIIAVNFPNNGNAEVTGSNPVEALIFFIALKIGKFTAMIILHFHECYYK